LTRSKRDLDIAVAGFSGNPKAGCSIQPSNVGIAGGLVLRDLAFSLRLLIRRPGFAAASVLTLALGIGGPAAIFSVVHAVLMRPLPYPEPDRLVQFRVEAHGPSGPIVFDAIPASGALDWSASSSTVSALALYNDRALTLSTSNGPFRLTGISATPNLFDILRVTPAYGRTFRAGTEDVRTIVLSHQTWRQFFAGDPAVIGTQARLDGQSYVIAGVMPEGFGFPTPDSAFWVPQIIDSGSSRGMLLPAVARLADGATATGVADEAQRLFDDGARDRPRVFVRTMQEQMVGGVQRMLWVLMAAVSFVFVIATTNIALLLLTRGAAREREFSVRLALGASRGRIVRQLFLDGLAFAAAGGVAGLILAAVSLQLLLQMAPADLPRLRDASLNVPTLAFACGLAGIAAIVFGLLGARRAMASDPVRAFGKLGGEPGGARARRRLSVLPAGELALTLVLLVAAGLLIRSFVRLALVDQGFEPEGALAMQINLPSARYPNPAARAAFHERLLERLQHVPGAAAAGITTSMPNRQPSARFVFDAAGHPVIDPAQAPPTGEVRTVSEGFFEAMQIPLLAGRTFRKEDAAGAEPAIVISERLATRHFAENNPVGRLLYSGHSTYRVVGVVGDVRPAAPGAEIAPAAYLPFRQDEETFRWFATVTIVMRAGDLDATTTALRALVLSLDPEMPPFNVRTLDAEVSRLVAAPRFSAALLAVFGAVALVLAAVGVFGVMSYSAQQRTRELGVRIALGATRAQLMRLVIRDGVLIVLVGLVTGLAASALLSRALTGLLYEVTPADPLAIAVVATVLSGVSLLAAYVPARRATRLNVTDALREQ
jgi:predicted permease